MKRILALLFFLSVLSILQAQVLELKQWEIKNSSEIEAADNKISQTTFNAEKWYSTIVPCTVLNTLVKNKVYPDPRIGLNNYLIPDVSDEFNRKMDLGKFNYLQNHRNPWQDPYWYRTTLNVPSNFKNKKLWLKLDGINYRVDIWVNGQLIADKNQIYGMFRRFILDVTDYIKAGTRNCIALKIYQVDHPGIPDPGTQLKFFGPTRGHATDIFKDETLKISGGWDCAPVVRDRNMGIYQKVTLEATGNTVIDNPFVVTTLPKGDVSLADINIKVELKNTSNKTVNGKLNAFINLINDVKFPTYTKHMDGYMPPIKVSKTISLNPGEKKTIELSSSEFSSLKVKHPYLWYPNGYGKQYLHHLELNFVTNGVVSDSKELDFGLREIKKEVRNIGGEAGLTYYINGEKIFCKGGWIQPDILLEESEKRINNEIRLMAEANVNLIGSEDMPSPSSTWLENCDKYGIMVWHVFMQCWRMYPGTETEHYPLDHQLAILDVKDIVLRYRNHPSIISWFGANEVAPDEHLYRAIKEEVKALDNSRPYIPTTSTSWDIKKVTPYMLEDLPTGTTDDGAPDYGWAPPSYFFNKVREVHLQTFRNELGIPSIPLYESLKKFIPSATNDSNFNRPYFPLDSIWAEHGAWDIDNYCFRSYDNAIRTLFGDPKNTEEYSKWAQLINAEGYRAMFEAANHRMWDITSGVMIWKLNSCWPDVGWQIYDWYLNPNASYYFAKKAMEPIHIQLNANDFNISLINATSQPLNNVSVTAKVISRTLETSWEYSKEIDHIDPNSYKELATIPQCGKYSDPYFIKLELKDSTGRLLSDNLYWFYSQHIDLVGLTQFPHTELTRTIQVSKKEGEYVYQIQLENNTQQLSFFNHLTLKKKSGEEIHPVFWSDNFITLFPGEKKNITAHIAIADSNNEAPILYINQ